MEEKKVVVQKNNIFNSTATEAEADLIILPVAWEVTVQGRQGTSRAPEYILEASKNITIYSDFSKDDTQISKVFMLPIDKIIKGKSDYLKSSAELLQGCKVQGKDTDCNLQLIQKKKEIDEGCEMMQGWVHDVSKRILKEGKKIILLGGDQSTIYGYVIALSEIEGEFTILHIDAQPDLGKKHNGFKYSNGSIMYNILNNIPEINKIIQFGIRDMTKEEFTRIKQNDNRIVTFFDQPVKERIFEGENWKTIIEEIISHIPNKVYLSIDVDGLNQTMFPNSNIPVPGGIDIEILYYLIKKLKEKNKTIIGMDLTEISPGAFGTESIDPMIGARILNKLCYYFTKK